MAMTDEEKKALKKAQEEAAAQKKRADDLQAKLDKKDEDPEEEDEEEKEDEEEEEEEKEKPAFLKKKDKGKKDKGKKYDAESRLARLEAERDAERARADAAEKKLRKDTAQAKKDAKERRQLLDVVGSVCGDEVKLDGLDQDITDLDNRDLKRALIEHMDGDEIPADKLDAYIDGRFDSCVARLDEYEGDMDDIAEGAERFRKDGDGGNNVASARAAMIQRNQDAWRPGKGTN